MTTRLSLLLLLATVSATPALSADRVNTASHRDDAQARAGDLLRADITPLPTLYVYGAAPAASDRAESAQRQAADLLRGTHPGSAHRATAPAQVDPLGAEAPIRATVHADAQSQAQALMRGARDAR